MVALSTETTASPVEVKSSQLSIDEMKTQVPTLFAEGKRDYIAGDFERAAEKLGDAARYCVEVYGPSAPEAFDSHFYYGKALLEIGRAEDDVLKHAMKDMPIEEENEEENDDAVNEETSAEGNNIEVENPDTLTEEEREEIREKVDEALAENAEELEKGKGDAAKDETETEVATDATPETTTTAQSDDPATTETNATPVPETAEEPSEEAEAEDKKDEAEAQTEKKSDSEAEAINGEEAAADAEKEENGDGEKMESEEAGEGEGEEEEGADDEEPSSIQLAWEVLERARLICDGQQGPEWDLKKADVLLYLGECSIEDENFKQAIDDLNACLEIQIKAGCTGRVLAQTYFTLARAFKLDQEFVPAADFYSKAKQAIDDKIAELQKSVEGKEGDELKAIQDETASLQGLLPDFALKVEDALESAKQLDETKKKMAESLKEVLTTIPTAPTDDKPANTIEVRKAVKRPATNDESATVEAEAKKIKENDTENSAPEPATA